MKIHPDAAARSGFRPAQTVFALLLTAALAATSAHAQAASDQAKIPDAKSATEITQTIFLKNLTDQHELNEVQIDLRNMLPGSVKIYGFTSQYAISIHGSPEDIAMAEKIIAEFDKPRKTYRVTYTFTDREGGKPAETQTFSAVAASGERTVLKQGSRIPIVTGSYDSDSSKANTQVQYVDIGLSIDFTIAGHADMLSLHSKLEQSSLADEKSGLSAQDPVVRQSVREDTTSITLGKQLLIGSIDVPGVTHKQEISVVAELVQ